MNSLWFYFDDNDRTVECRYYEEYDSGKYVRIELPQDKFRKYFESFYKKYQMVDKLTKNAVVHQFYDIDVYEADKMIEESKRYTNPRESDFKTIEIKRSTPVVKDEFPSLEKINTKPKRKVKRTNLFKNGVIVFASAALITSIGVFASKNANLKKVHVDVNDKYTIEETEKNNICMRIDDGNYVDVKVIEPDGMWIKKDQLLDLQKDFNNKSLLENKRIYVIQEADKLNVAAANTLLKFLEEPADDIIAILLTKNRYKLLDTILSRCQVLTIGSEDDSYDYNEEINTIISYIVKGDSLFINYGSLLELLPDKNIAMDYFKKIEIIFLDFLQNNKSLYSCLSGVNKDSIICFLNIIEVELMKLDYNVNYKLWLDSLFSKLIGGVSND